MATLSHQLTDRVKLLQKVVILFEGKCLLLKRAADTQSRPGLWDLPGGNMEWPATATSEPNLHRAEAVREVLEETGVTLENRQITQPSYVGSYFDAEKNIFTILLGWKVDVLTKPEVTLSYEHSDFAWVDSSEIDDYDFGFAGGKDGFIRSMLENAFGIYPV